MTGGVYKKQWIILKQIEAFRQVTYLKWTGLHYSKAIWNVYPEADLRYISVTKSLACLFPRENR